jgi:quercetin dioxygenase-like cupin family protein
MSETIHQPASSAISIAAVAGELPGPWQRRDLVAVNDAIVRIVRLEGEFPWHEHQEDELFLCWDGAFRIELENEAAVAMETGSIFVVPRGKRHRPVAEVSAHALLLERPETSQYGDR